ncbi:MAG: pyridoxamine 5'-phosphate oxidase family protein [Beijerinckiaceae bacterium]
MTAHYLDLLSSVDVKAAQTVNGSRTAYARNEGVSEGPDALGGNEAAFIASRDSFYLATMGSGGWPYLQHRGGPPGFMKVIDDRTLAMADFRGNRQYISIGNAAGNDKASLFFMDYARRGRLKLLARMRMVGVDDEPALTAAVALPDYKAKVERILVFDVEAFDWNCSQHITPRFTMEDIDTAVGAMRARISELEKQLAAGAAAP